MPKILKNFMWAEAQKYAFPRADELWDEDGDDNREVFLPEEDPEGEPVPPEDSAPAEDAGEALPGEAGPVPLEECAPAAGGTPIDFAQIQAEAILADARNRAAEVIAQARREAEEQIRQTAQEGRDNGYRDGYAAGLLQAETDGRQQQELKAAQLEAEVHCFLDEAAQTRDRLLDENVDELRDLAVAIAEKVISVSLRSSGEVIAKMIQTALEKRKKREWVHIYISGCDAKNMAQASPALTKALAAVSDRVRIIPMANDERGTCVIETPDEIIDASVSTQMSNIQNLLRTSGQRDTDGPGGMFQFNFR